MQNKESDLLDFSDFGDLGSIIIENWDYFDSLIESQNWLKMRMDELEKARNSIAHNRLLLDDECQRIYMYIEDWDKAIGF